MTDCDGCTGWGKRYHELQQKLQWQIIEVNDKRIAAEERVAKLEAKLARSRSTKEKR